MGVNYTAELLSKYPETGQGVLVGSLQHERLQIKLRLLAKGEKPHKACITIIIHGLTFEAYSQLSDRPFSPPAASFQPHPGPSPDYLNALQPNVIFAMTILIITSI